MILLSRRVPVYRKCKICDRYVSENGHISNDIYSVLSCHLDAAAIDALKEAVTNFEGSVIFVSHSKDFCALADSTLDMEKLFDD
ncbi:hypothetical protein CCDG5_1503 [[Clostridium] cellulosi]|uniref:Uncharacterized protein n=1 Tax=[Clostridium] cellulosi TaxID=29343 RepID=A0A078KQA6_9FIRM|nr:MAG: hypothetical protein DIU81_03755 [[Clostridium] cellulosi]CDZ24613.1 hypothetical protein CCDG5_1503 [[Clostridium] cellulosi]